MSVLLTATVHVVFTRTAGKMADAMASGVTFTASSRVLLCSATAFRRSAVKSRTKKDVVPYVKATGES